MAQAGQGNGNQFGSNNRGSAPRPEGELKSWDELTDPQKKAAEGIHTLFSQMAADEWPESAKKVESDDDIFLPKIDASRKSRVALVDGARGTGKTVVLLRLIQDWSAAVKNSPDPNPILPRNPAIVPIGLIDLETLPPTTNLAIHLAGLLQRVVEAIEKRFPKRIESPPWAPHQGDDLNSRVAWRKFIKSAASAWDSQLQRRQGSVDPETYSLELEQAERDRLHVVPCFRKFVDALVEDYRAWKPGNHVPLFVLAIDDADMNPEQVPALFELLRTLWHPRLAFLISGETDMFTEVLVQRYRKSMDVPAQTEFTAGQAGAPGAEGRLRMAERLAEDIFRKAIPPTQRFELHRLSLSQRVDVIAKALNQESSSEHSQELWNGLTAVFELDPQANMALPSRMRDLLDLKERFLHPAEGQDDKERLSLIVMRLWETAIRGYAPSKESRTGLQNAVYYDERAKRLITAPKNVVWQPDTLDLPLSAGPKGSEGIELSFLRKFDAILRLPGGRLLSLNARLSGVLALAMDLAACEDFLSRPVPHERLWKKELAFVHSYELRAGVGDVVFSWPLPSWEPFVKYWVFARAWQRRVLNGIPNSIESIDELARVYIAFVLAVCNGARDWRQLSEMPAETWDTLAEKVGLLGRDPAAGAAWDESGPDWAKYHVGLLAAPEYGLPADSANQWWSGLKRVWSEEWKDEWPTICDNRVMYVAKAFYGASARKWRTEWASARELWINRELPEQQADSFRNEIFRYLCSTEQFFSSHQFTADFQQYKMIFEEPPEP